MTSPNDQLEELFGKARNLRLQERLSEAMIPLYSALRINKDKLSRLNNPDLKHTDINVSALPENLFQAKENRAGAYKILGKVTELLGRTEKLAKINVPNFIEIKQGRSA